MTKVLLAISNQGFMMGGGEHSFLDLISHISPDWKVIAVMPKEGELGNRLRKRGINTKVIPLPPIKPWLILNIIFSLKAYFDICRKYRPVLIYANGSRASLYGGIVGRILKLPVIWHCRIADPDVYLDFILGRLCSRIISNSKATARRFKPYFQKKIKIIYNGIDLEEFNPCVNGEKIKREFQFSDETSLVGIVGRLDWYKGHHYFFEAAKAVSEKLPNVSFLVVGDGEYRNRLEDQVKQLRLEKNVIFIGNRNDIPEILAIIDLFVLSSVSEGFGRAAVEAMACSKPVVATNVGGIPEVVEDGVTGRLVPAKDPTALAEAIIEILSDKRKSENMGLAGRMRVEELFSIERSVRSIIELYEEVLATIE